MVKVVGVVGGGIMGSGIAEVAARSGCDVVVREVDERGRGARQARLDRVAGQGRPGRQDSPRPSARPRWTG